MKPDQWRHARYLTLLRTLALLPVVAATAHCGTGSSLDSVTFCPENQSLPSGGAVAAQCAAPGPIGAPCIGQVTCSTLEGFCCGRWYCTDQYVQAARPDAGVPVLHWEQVVCRGPLPPPDLAA